MENNSVDPLTEIAAARSAAADRMVTPWWYAPIQAVLMGGVVLAYGLGGIWVRNASIVVFLLGCLLLVQSYKRLTGVWMSGLDAPKPARRWAIATGVGMAVCVFGAMAVREVTDEVWPVWALAVAAMVLTIAFSWMYDIALRKNLRAGL